MSSEREGEHPARAYGATGGGFAEVAVVPSALAIAVPDAVASEQAAAAPLVFSTAVLLLEEFVRLRPGESVLMHSAGGGVGSAVAQVAAVVAAAPRIGVVGDASRSDAAARAGWNHVVTTGAGPAAVRELLPEGVDAVLDPTGTVNLDFDLRSRHLARASCCSGTPLAAPRHRCRRSGGLSAGTWGCSGSASAACAAPGLRRWLPRCSAVSPCWPSARSRSTSRLSRAWTRCPMCTMPLPRGGAPASTSHD